MLRSFRRSVSITQVHTPSTPSFNTTTSQDNIKNVQNLVQHKTLDIPIINCIGSPQSVLSVNSPPSVPLFLRRKSLLSIFGTNSLNVRLTLELIFPFRRLIFGNFTSIYQKLQSTTPFSVLVSASSSNKFNKTFANLVLDGQNDWAILNKNSLQAYTGNSLNISLHLSPKDSLRKWNLLGYTLLSGRGQAALVGNGTLYNINVPEGEHLLINRKNLLAITVNGPNDLQNCISRHTFPETSIPVENQASDANIQNEFIAEIEPESQIRKYWNKLFAKKQELLPEVATKQPLDLTEVAKKDSSDVIASPNQFKNYWNKLALFLSKSKVTTKSFLVGNTQFLKVEGPRNLLIQSDLDQLVTSVNLPSIQNKEIPRQSQDYLSYATIDSSKRVNLRSTPDFKETLDEMDKRIASKRS